MQQMIISPSILAADFARLGEEVENVLSSGADWVHFDVMDNHYVPNLTVGPMVCKALREYGIKAPIDVHLMTAPVDDLVYKFSEADASIITFHPEASLHVDRTINLIKDQGCQVGLALNPATRIEMLEYIIDKVDLVLLMSVNPGFGGQTFITSTLNKIRAMRSWLDKVNPNVRIQVDGGINIDNIYEIALAGADTFVSGSAIFNASDYQDIIQKMRAELMKV